MKVVIAPDSFKDALRAKEVAQRIGDGLRSVAPAIAIDACPIADGGEGFTEAIESAYPSQSQSQSLACTDPLGRDIRANVTVVTRSHGPRIAALELAAASGLELLVAHEREVMQTSTFGTGELIRQTLTCQPEHLLLGIGGSATTDGGCGLAQALGVQFSDADGQVIVQPITGGVLSKVNHIELGERAALPRNCSIKIACDVTNPLTGPNGAAHVYAPQKGATLEQVEELDKGLRHMARLWLDQLGVDVEHMPGAGAAGGVGGGLVAMLGAELLPGAELVLDTIKFDERIKGADLVITGEGRLDSQSLQGKAAMAVAKRCQQAGVPCVALVGSVGERAEQALNHGLTAYHVIGEGLEPAESIRRTGELLEAAAMKLAQERLT